MKCAECGKEQEKPPHYSAAQWARRRYCSKSCKARALQPAGLVHWKGGRSVLRSGYVYIHQPTHLFATRQGYVMEHRLVMEKMIGRYVLPGEHVHHKNGIRGDNQPDNLEVLDRQEHNRRHSLVSGFGRGNTWARHAARDAQGRFVGVSQ